MENEIVTSNDANPGSAPAIVEQFTIDGLHGYRSVSLTSRYAATILIAKNGAGKTTLLGALDAFLRGQFLRLLNLKFTKIRCKLRGVGSELVLTSNDVRSMLEYGEDSELPSTARRYGIDPLALLEFVQLDYPIVRNQSELSESEVFKKISSKHRYSSIEARKVLDRVADIIRSSNPNLQALHAAIKQAIGETEIVYLPTYRRIELPLSESEEDRMGVRRPSVQSRLGLSRKGLFNPDIQFGLSDISERLSRLNQEILLSSNQGYGEISAGIISELLDGTFERTELMPTEIPDKESLTLFFDRIREGSAFGPRTLYSYHFASYRDITIPDIDQIYSEGALSGGGNKKFLIYFLTKLNTVIQATRAIERRVEDFIDHCNTYLSAQDPSTDVGDKYPRTSPDDKKLCLDRKTLRVHVESTAAKRKISMDSLSSGEKQMISLFARLYLYSGPKMVLIDEPELSLSIDWQRKILLDVVTAPTCKQVIAITHSPFVFENELEPYAKSLEVHIDASAQVEASDLEDEIIEQGISGGDLSE